MLKGWRLLRIKTSQEEIIKKKPTKQLKRKLRLKPKRFFSLVHSKLHSGQKFQKRRKLVVKNQSHANITIGLTYQLEHK